MKINVTQSSLMQVGAVVLMGSVLLQRRPFQGAM